MVSKRLTRNFVWGLRPTTSSYIVYQLHLHRSRSVRRVVDFPAGSRTFPTQSFVSPLLYNNEYYRFDKELRTDFECGFLGQMKNDLSSGKLRWADSSLTDSLRLLLDEPSSLWCVDSENISGCGSCRDVILTVFGQTAGRIEDAATRIAWHFICYSKHKINYSDCWQPSMAVKNSSSREWCSRFYINFNFKSMRFLWRALFVCTVGSAM